MPMKKISGNPAEEIGSHRLAISPVVDACASSSSVSFDPQPGGRELFGGIAAGRLFEGAANRLFADGQLDDVARFHQRLELRSTESGWPVGTRQHIWRAPAPARRRARTTPMAMAAGRSDFAATVAAAWVETRGALGV
jgi:hypothetical protein